jgi:hypothetical protein
MFPKHIHIGTQGWGCVQGCLCVGTILVRRPTCLVKAAVILADIIALHPCRPCRTSPLQCRAAGRHRYHRLGHPLCQQRLARPHAAAEAVAGHQGLGGSSWLRPSAARQQYFPTQQQQQHTGPCSSTGSRPCIPQSPSPSSSSSSSRGWHASGAGCRGPRPLRECCSRGNVFPCSGEAAGKGV